MAPRARQPQPEPSARRNWIAPVGPDAGTIGRTAFERAGFADPTLVLRWQEIAGADVACLAQPLKLSQGPSGWVLTLRADPAAAMFLQHESRALCARINTYLGRPAVTRLRFIQAPMASRRPSPSPQTSLSDVPPEDPALAFQGQENLKSALLRLARLRRNASPGARD